MTRSCLSSQTDVVFVVMDALENVLEDEVLILHCHENGDCQAHAFDLSCSNLLMISNQNTHAFRPNFLVAPFTTQWRLPWADFFIWIPLPVFHRVFSLRLQTLGVQVPSWTKVSSRAPGWSQSRSLRRLGACISALSHSTSKENDKKARFFPCPLH